VGHELGVRYTLEGSIRRAGDRVRITGQLIERGYGRATAIDVPEAYMRHDPFYVPRLPRASWDWPTTSSSRPRKDWAISAVNGSGDRQVRICSNGCDNRQSRAQRPAVEAGVEDCSAQCLGSDAVAMRLGYALDRPMQP